MLDILLCTYFSAPAGTRKTVHIGEEFQFSVRHRKIIDCSSLYIALRTALARKLELLVLGLVVAPVSGDSTWLRRSLNLSVWCDLMISIEMYVGTWHR